MKASSLERRNYKWIVLFLLPSFLVFLFFYLQPILSIFLTSFTKYDGFNSPRFVGLQNYIQLFWAGILSAFHEESFFVVSHCHNSSCGFRNDSCFCFVSKAEGLEIHQSGFYGTQCDFRSSLGFDLSLHFQ